MREKKDIEDQYNILRARLSATQMTGSMSSIISNVRPLDKAATPLKPVSPSMRTNVAIAGIFALLLGLALVVLTVFLDRSIKSPVDASQSAGVPVLGIIPMLAGTEASDDRHRDLYVHDNPTSATAECCRSIRTNIMLSAADRKARTIVVSSANPREGKTTTVMYLGTTIAQSGDGERVLLIDTDMRRPRLHASTGISRERGLANLILGEDDYDGVIKPTEIPNLFILPCGPLPPNPAELLMTRRFETVLAELGKRFSRIILDSPPLPYTDAVVLSKRTDGVILVARAGKTLRDDLKRSAKQIRRVDGAILGVIVNEFNDHQGGAYYYYSYYGSGRPDEKRPSEAA
jgi:capsular exopolysaccharide synthesis family protein